MADLTLVMGISLLSFLCRFKFLIQINGSDVQTKFKKYPSILEYSYIQELSYINALSCAINLAYIDFAYKPSNGDIMYV